jgi:hypothetical protein
VDRVAVASAGEDRLFELDPQRRDELAQRWATRIVERGLGALAVFLLEAHKPLSGLGAHALLAVEPLLAGVVPLRVGELAAFLHDGNNVEHLLQCIEQREQARAAAARVRRVRRGAARRRARRMARRPRST